MKSYAVVLWLLFFCFFQGCGGDQNKQVKSGAVKLDTTHVTITETTMEPDPLDSIMAGEDSENRNDKKVEEMVRKYLKARFKSDLNKNLIDDVSRNFVFFTVDLNGDSFKEVFVGLAGPYFCGTGGCTILLLKNSGELITKFTVIDYPIYARNSTSNGWKELLLLNNGKYRLATFDGKSYPSNPSLLPASLTIPSSSDERLVDYTLPYPSFKF